MPIITIPYNLRAFQNGSEAVKLAGQRRSAIHTGMRFVGGWRFRRLLSVLGRPRGDPVQPEGVSRRFRSGETRRTAAIRYTERYAHCRRAAISPLINRLGTPAVQPEGVLKRLRVGETRRAAAMRYTERYAHCRRAAISPAISRFGTPVYQPPWDARAQKKCPMTIVIGHIWSRRAESNC